ncbi:MAG: hypothetical protein ABEJ74_01315 [Haloferacaceae archaeon]
MRIPVPTNKLVAFTLVGAVLTTLVAGGLAFPGALDRIGLSDATGASPTPTSDGGASVATTPAPNPGFTPAVQTRYRTPVSDQGAATSAPAPTATPPATPTPNPNFTPAVQSQSTSRGEHEEYEEEDDD